MRLKNGGKFIAAILAVLCSTAIIWSSCKKKSAVATCNYYVCLNGGYCHMDTVTDKPACVCPVGYEGVNCNTLTVDKFMGTWDMMQVTTGSDSMDFKNDTLYYPVLLRKTATPTTFFILNFSNNPYYTSILCVLDTSKLHTNWFDIDTMSAKQLFYDNFHLIRGNGSLNDSVINARLLTKHLSPTSNWIRDTFDLTMTKRR